MDFFYLDISPFGLFHFSMDSNHVARKEGVAGSGAGDGEGG